MDRERWKRVKKLFQEAVELPDAERTAWLDRAGAGDPELRREVAAMLAADRQAGSFIESPALETRAADHEGAPGRQVGAYRLVREIGEGGMSTVFLAHRDDDAYRQEVAVKLLRTGAFHPDLRRRFRTERQILAQLDHPYLARLLDGGTTPDGVPYLVMDYVEGLPIDHYCDRHGLSVARRLELFCKVCAAVHYAHQNLFVHRDIKPENVLVTAAGVPKLLDFGIAKLLDPAAFPGTVERTQTGQRLLTPHYASPEQLLGGPVTTASDVYSLGVLLYRLLSGRLPYDFAGSEPDPTVFEREPEKPSTAVRRAAASVEIGRARGVSAERLRTQLAGDLDDVVLMALRREPERRYGSAEKLAEDLQRHLEGLPVEARRNTRGYRLGKFVRRHRLSVSVAATFAVWLLGFAVMMAVQTERVARERDRAELERDRARQVTGFLEEIFEISDPGEARGETITAREILDRGAARIDSELADQPEVQASLMGSIGRVYLNLGLYERAQSELRDAVEIRRRVHGRRHPEVARGLDDLATLMHARGDYAAAQRLAREALAMQRELLGAEHEDVASSLSILAAVERARGEYEAAESLYRQALDMWRRLLGGDDERVALALSNLAVLRQDQGDYEGAEALYRQALAVQEKLLGADHPDVVLTLGNLATVRNELGDAAGSESLFREVVERQRQTLGDGHPALALNLHNLATVLQDRGEYEAAETLFREALDVRLRAQGEGHPMVAFALHSLAVCVRDRGEPERAEPLLRRSLELGRASMGEDHPLRAYTLLALGRVLLDRGDAAAAEPLFREGLDIWRAALPAGDWQTAAAESLVGVALSRLGRFEEAESLLAGSCSVLADRRGGGDERAREARAWLVELYERWGKDGRAAAVRCGSPG